MFMLLLLHCFAHRAFIQSVHDTSGLVSVIEIFKHVDIKMKV